MPAVQGRLTGWRAGLVWLVTLVEIPFMSLVAGFVAWTQAYELVLVAAALVLFVASLGTVGALIATRQRRNPIGWILWLSAFALTLGMIIDAYVTASLTTGGGDLPSTVWLAWLLGFLFTPFIGALLIIVPLLFPNGHLLSRRWRWVVGLAIAVGVATILPTLFQPGPLEGNDQIFNPVGIEAVGNLRGFLDGASALGLAVVLPLVLASLVLRFRRGSSTEQQQVKWFAAAVILTGSCFAVAVLPIGPLPFDFWLAWVVAIPLIPIAIGIAILRYRLYEIDRIISRTVSWAVVTGVLVVAFAAGVIALQAVLAGLTQGETLAVAASTLVAFALFQPVRRRVQRIVDRRFDRARYDGRKVVDAFGKQLRDEVDLDRLRTTLLATADDVVRPVNASVWIRSVDATP